MNEWIILRSVDERERRRVFLVAVIISENLLNSALYSQYSARHCIVVDSFMQDAENNKNEARIQQDINADVMSRVSFALHRIQF